MHPPAATFPVAAAVATTALAADSIAPVGYSIARQTNHHSTTVHCKVQRHN